MTRTEIANLVVAAVEAEADYYGAARVWTKGGYVRVYVTDTKGREAGAFVVERDGQISQAKVKHATACNRVLKAVAAQVVGPVVDEFAGETPRAVVTDDANHNAQVRMGTLEGWDR